MYTINDSVTVSGAFVSNNWAQGSVRITPEPNEVTTVTVSGLNLEGTGDLNIQLTARSEYPWKQVKNVTFSPPEADAEEDDDEEMGMTSFDVFLYRTNGTTTDIHWLVWRDL